MCECTLIATIKQRCSTVPPCTIARLCSQHGVMPRTERAHDGAGVPGAPKVLASAAHVQLRRGMAAQWVGVEQAPAAAMPATLMPASRARCK